MAQAIASTSLKWTPCWLVALGGGDKSNQQKDIDRAIEPASILKAAQLKATQTMKGKLP